MLWYDYIFIYHFALPSDSKEIFWSLGQAAASPSLVNHTRCRIHTVPLDAGLQVGKHWITIFTAFERVLSDCESNPRLPFQ